MAPFISDAAPGALTEPVTKDEAKAQCRVDVASADEDALLDRCIKAARETVERRTGHLLIRRARAFTVDKLAGIRLVETPIASIDAITYLDTAAAPQTLAASVYYASLKARPVFIVPGLSKVFPAVASLPGAVTVTYTAGYATAADVPASLKQAMLLLIGHWFENRETIAVGTISTALQFTFDELVEDIRPNSFA